MRILHTSDWHLGRTLENRDRLVEQEDFIQELCELAETKKVDLVLIAGDVFDTVNPPAKAEKLFYQAIHRLANGGQRGVVVIAGNHDNPERLKAAELLAEEMGIILLGLPKDVATVNGPREAVASVVASGSGWLEMAVPGCPDRAIVLTLPYPSEQRLKEVLVQDLDEEVLQQSYSQRVGAFLAEAALQYRPDTVNLCVSHLYVTGSKESDSERPVQLGGACTVEREMLPQGAQYIALGHLHRPQKVGGRDNIRYSGSPLAHSFSEANQTKYVYLVDCLPGEEAQVEEVSLNSGRPLVRWQASQGYEQVITWCEENRDPKAWIDLEINLTQPLQASQIKELRNLRPGIINIRPLLPEMSPMVVAQKRSQLPVKELFRLYYHKNYSVDPPPELMDLFLSLVENEKEGSNS